MNRFALILVLSITPALWAGVDRTLPLDISDVSMLMPIPDLKAPTAVDIPFSSAGGLGVLFSKANFVKLPLLKDILIVQDVGAVYANSYISGIRVDACAPGVSADADPKKCGIALMRLVGQIFEEQAHGTEALDFGLHLIYAIKIDEAFVEDLQNLKKEAKAMGVDTTGEALGVHPALRGDYRKNSKAIAWGTKLKAFVLKYAGEKAQIGSSIMVTHQKNNTLVWEWAKVPFDSATKRVLEPGDKGYDAMKPALQIGNVQGVHFSHAFTAESGERAGVVSAKSTQVPELEGLLVENIPAPKDSQASYDAAYKIENPRLLSIPQSDCVSCHVATSYRLFGEKEWGTATSPNAFPAVSGITGKMQKDIQDFMESELYVVLNFAYVFDRPSISQRTVNESVEVARFLNKNFISN